MSGEYWNWDIVETDEISQAIFQLQRGERGMSYTDLTDIAKLKTQVVSHDGADDIGMGHEKHEVSMVVDEDFFNHGYRPVLDFGQCFASWRTNLMRLCIEILPGQIIGEILPKATFPCSNSDLSQPLISCNGYIERRSQDIGGLASSERRT